MGIEKTLTEAMESPEAVAKMRDMPSADLAILLLLHVWTETEGPPLRLLDVVIERLQGP